MNGREGNNFMNYRHVFLTAVFVFLLEALAVPVDISYDPLDISHPGEVEILDLKIMDKEREREIPLRVYLPNRLNPAPVVLFSHGLGGSCKGNGYLGKHWAGRGYAVAYLQHPGSDSSVWKNVAMNKRLSAMKKAASLENLLHRVKDVSIVLDQLEEWNIADGHILANRLDLNKVGMSGHSFGAITTQTISGQIFGNISSLTDRRIKAAVMFSPRSPTLGNGPEHAFGKVKIPWMLMTGTKDFPVFGGGGVESRLAVFPALPPGGKYEIVLFDALHSAFSDSRLAELIKKKNPNHHRVILALSTAFWDSWLAENKSARTWLDGEGPYAVLEKKDRWQRK